MEIQIGSLAMGVAQYTPAMSGPPRILVVEDDETLRDALLIVLREEGATVQGESDGLAIDSVLEVFRPDLAVVDVRLPVGPSGLGIARSIRQQSDLPILFLTAAANIEDRLAGFEAGGDDYLTKPFSMPELIARIQALLRRAGRLTSPIRVVLDIEIDEGARLVRRRGQEVDLTRTEFDLLSALARRPGQVFPKARLLALVWDYEHYDPNVVEVHISALRRKLEAHGPRVIQTVRGVGYVLRS
jgi:DNA-binding response OmpR family regulator